MTTAALMDAFAALERLLPPGLAALAVRSTIVLVLACVAGALLHRRSAAARHAVWCAALAVLGVLPVIAFAPRWHVMPPVSGLAPLPPALLPTELRLLASPAAGGSAGTDSRIDVHRLDESGIRRGILVVWAAGGVVAFTPVLIGTMALRRLARRSPALNGTHWARLLEQSRDALGVRGPVDLRAGPAGAMPMTWGVRIPIILLPADAERWSEARQRHVLLHELAHVRRRDALTSLIALAVRSVYWIHPLTWVAIARLQAERERACDDAVLAVGTPAPEYARTLVEIVADRVPRPWPIRTAGLAMARQARLGRRVSDILDAGRDRARLGIRPIAALAFVTAGVGSLVGAAAPIAPATSAVQQALPSIPVRAPDRQDAPPPTPVPAQPVVRQAVGEAAMQLRGIVIAVQMYALANERRLPPDLGAILQYVALPPGSKVSNAERARTFLFPSDLAALEIPADPTPEWINTHTSFVYLGHADVSLTDIPAWDRFVVAYPKDADRFSVEQAGGPNVPILPVAMLDSGVRNESPAWAEAIIAETTATITALRGGGDLPVLQQAAADLNRIAGGIRAYAAQHGGRLPPDLGATLEHLPPDPRVPDSPAARARTYLSPATRSTAQIPGNPTPEWVNANSWYVYLGWPEQRLEAIEQLPELVLVHAGLAAPLEGVAPGRADPLDRASGVTRGPMVPVGDASGYTAVLPLAEAQSRVARSFDRLRRSR